MVKQVLLGGVLGGFVLFAWLAFSWAVLPFHRAALHELPHKVYDSTTGRDVDGPTAAVVTMQGTGVVSHGIYYSGSPHKGSSGPEIPFMVWLPRGYSAMQAQMLRGLLLSVLAALFVTFVVLNTRQARYKSRIVVATCIGAVVALAGPLTTGNFFFFPPVWMFLDLLDQLIGWTLAGTVIALFTKPTLISN
jgi:hypothetical protein